MLLKRMSSVSAMCGGAAGLAIVLPIQQGTGVAGGFLTGVVALLCAAPPGQ